MNRREFVTSIVAIPSLMAVPVISPARRDVEYAHEITWTGEFEMVNGRRHAIARFAFGRWNVGSKTAEVEGREVQVPQWLVDMEAWKAETGGDSVAYYKSWKALN